MLERLTQDSNAFFPIFITLSGIVTLESPHYINARSPMLVMLSGIETLAIDLQK